MSKAKAWLASRGISNATSDAFGLVIDGDKISFPYRRGTEPVYIKHRGPQKRFWADEGGELRLYNLDRALGAKKVVICEGEMDALAIFETGIEAVVSVPNGAPQKSGNLDRYKYIISAWEEGLLRDAEIIIAVDNDGPGRALAADLEMLMGSARCRIVTWPEGCKDANDALMQHGADALYDLIVTAPRVKVDGVFRLSEIETPPPLVTWDVGIPGTDSQIRFAPTTLSVVTGYPGHGKSSLMYQIWLHIARTYGVKIAMFSAEVPVRPHLLRQLRQFFWGKPEHELTPDQIRIADEFLEEHFIFLMPSKQAMTFDRLLDLMEYCAIEGCKAMVIDPWNKLEADRGTTSETDFIGQCLDALLGFARRYQVHVQVIAHPSKQQGPNKSEAPHGQDISGSANWNNRSDQLLVVHRTSFWDDQTKTRNTDAKLIQRKARFQDLGYPCAVNITFDLRRQIFVGTDYPQAPVNG